MIKILLIYLLLSFFTTTVSASSSTEKVLDTINQRVCDRFEQDISKLAAIMEEVRDRKGITETRVAFGGVDTPIKSADYQITYAAEALAYQRVQKYSGKNELRYSLEVLKGKVLRAKNEVRKALQDDEQ